MSDISQRAKNFPNNPIRGMEPLVKEAKSKGITVIPLNIGAPDTNSPQESKDAIANFLANTPAIPYGPSVGNYKLLEELSNFYTKTLNFKDITTSNIAVTQGASEALDLVLYTVADRGESIATFDPAYPNYLAIAYRHGINVTPIQTDISNSFHFNPNDLETSIPTDTKAILWSCPCNPTGAVYTKEELMAILEFARKRDIWLIADEVYRSLSFEDKKEGFNRSLSILDIATKEDRKRIIVLDSMSKLLGLCGARIGTIIAQPEVIEVLVKQASVRGSASTISQAGIEAINEIPLDYYDNYNSEFKQRRDIMYSELTKLESIGVKVSPKPPEGAFYLIADLGVNAFEFSKWLITDYPKISKSTETVFLTPMTTPNGGFYIRKGVGDTQVRMAYVINKELLIKAVEIIGDAIKVYKSL